MYTHIYASMKMTQNLSIHSFSRFLLSSCYLTLAEVQALEYSS